MYHLQLGVTSFSLGHANAPGLLYRHNRLKKDGLVLSSYRP
jgi:hypothetical protein